MGEIRFYEGDNCSQHYIGKLNSDFTQSWDLTLISAPVSSETAKSCTLIDVKPGTEIRLYDDTFGLSQQNSAGIQVGPTSRKDVLTPLQPRYLDQMWK